MLDFTNWDKDSIREFFRNEMAKGVLHYSLVDDDTCVNRLGFSNRCTNGLIRNRIYTYGSLVAYVNNHRLADLPYFGQRSVSEVMDYLVAVDKFRADVGGQFGFVDNNRYARNVLNVIPLSCDSMSVASIPLERRFINILINSGFRTIGDIRAYMSHSDLSTVALIGDKSAEVIKEYVSSLVKKSVDLYHFDCDFESFTPSTDISDIIDDKEIIDLCRLLKCNVFKDLVLFDYVDHSNLNFLSFADNLLNKFFAFLKSIRVPVVDNAVQAFSDKYGCIEGVRSVFLKIWCEYNCNSLDEFVYHGCEDSSFLDVFCKALLSVFDRDYVSLYETNNTWFLPSFIRNTDIENHVIDYFRKCPWIVEDDNGVFRKMSFLEYINSDYFPVEKDKYRYIVNRINEGATESQIGEELGCTRSRVGQIFDKIAYTTRCVCFSDNKYGLHDELFIDLYKRYTVHWSAIVDIFGCNNVLGMYVKRIVPLGYREFRDLSEIENDSKVSPYVKEKVVLYVKNGFSTKYAIVDGVQLPLNVNDLCDYIVSHHQDEVLTVSRLTDLYLELLDSLNVKESQVSGQVNTYVKNRLPSSLFVVWSAGSEFRYYDIMSRDYDDLLNGLHFEDYVDLEVSALLLFEKHSDLMAEYDIRNEYELHNLLKKISNKVDRRFDLKFGRMPMLKFGNADRREQFRKLRESMGGVSFKAIALEYEKMYGVRQDVLCSNYHLYV